ncbi:MAG TPA: GMC family oxidoreductase, partial [Gaiellaceae bacterium]|nr:GMC family oxidoreductase [Gaiellaceae bacterium]
MSDAFDVIVVGSGSGGAVVARRLVDADVSVCVIEAGGMDENPAIHDPGRLWELWGSPDDWAYTTVPQPGCNGRSVDIPRGKVLGGSTCLNGMIYIRGHRSDYDAWAADGCDGWGYDDVLPLFRRSEDFSRGESEYHGAGGLLHVSADYEPHPLQAAVVEAAQEIGITFNDDHNGPTQDGVGYCHLTIKDNVRQSQTVAFLRPVLGASNLTVLTGTRVRRLVLEGGRCVGVDVGGRELRARQEVVLSAGTIESPKLLMLSGIGPAAELARVGVEVAVDLPGVGGNLHDHVLSPVVCSSSRPMPATVPGTNPLHVHLFARSKGDLPAPDTQPLFFHVPAYLPGMEGPPDGFTLMGGIVRPQSRGRLTLASGDPDAPPLIDPAYLAEEADVDTLQWSFEQAREIGRAGALAEWLGEELYPGLGISSSEDVRNYIRDTAITYHHQVGTCRMGVDELA